MCLWLLLHITQDDVAACFEYYADLAEALDSRQKTPVPLHLDSFNTYVLREPLGVVGLITPWYVLTLLQLGRVFISKLLNFIFTRKILIFTYKIL